MLVEQFGPTIEAQPGVTVVACPFRNGASIVSVIVVHAGGLAVVDAGVQETLKQDIEPQVAKLGKSVADIREVVITHADGDHAGSLEAMVDASKAAAIMHPQSANRLELNNAREIADGETFTAGGITWQGLHTPGHRRDMLTLYSPERRLMIVSDAVQGRGTPWARFPLLGFSGDAYRSSIERLVEMDVQTLILGHPYGWSGAPAFVRQGAECRQFLAESLTAAREIGAATREVANSAGPEADKATLIALISKRLAPSFGLQFDEQGAPHASVTSTLECELRDIGRA